MTAQELQNLKVGQQLAWNDQRGGPTVLVTVVQNGQNAVGSQVDPANPNVMLAGSESYLGLKFPDDPVPRFFPVDKDFPALEAL